MGHRLHRRYLIEPKLSVSIEAVSTSGMDSDQTAAGVFRPIRTHSLLDALFKMVGVARFELTTPCSRSRCATRLRHTPTFEECSPLYCPKMPASSHDKRAQNPSLQGRGEISMLPPSCSGDVTCFSDIAGASPSGKAAAFDAAMRSFESCRPSQFQIDLTN